MSFSREHTRCLPHLVLFPCQQVSSSTPRHSLDRGCEIIGHGISVSRMITSNMSELEEGEYIRTALETLKRATGATPVGWVGPEYGESTVTPQLLAQAGIRYVCDWANDEQPYSMNTPQGKLFALPFMLDLEDINALWYPHVTIDRYAELIKECFDTMYRDGAENGRLLVLSLHPWLIGQPFSIGYLDDALGYIMRHQGVWAATGSQIIDWYSRNSPGV